MAHRARSHPQNVPGPFFVDSACIDCDTCRQIAPMTFGAIDGHSFVQLQPDDPTELQRAAAAVLACPVDAIGGDALAIRAAPKFFPAAVLPSVWYLGWTSRHSFGASSYLLQTPSGWWMIDSPRYAGPLAKRIDALLAQHGASTLAGIFLTHRDDVADAARWAERYHAPRWIHALDASAHPEAEHQCDIDTPSEITPGLLAIPTPGHTPGSWCLLHDGRLFSGDHLWWSRPRKRLNASQEVCWFDWPTQVRSLALLRGLDFHALLPGHGERRLGTVASLRGDLDHLLTIVQQPMADTEWP